jgi:hypothetical protein
MIALRIIRVILVVAGLAAATLGLVMIATDARVSGGTLGASWTCEADSGAADMRCTTNGASYSGPGGLVNTIGWLGLPIGGVALIGAAIALGQFDRPRTVAVPVENLAAASGPVPPGRGHQPMQGGASPGRW